MLKRITNYGTYLDIINAIGKWKIIDCKTLHGKTKRNLSYYTLKKKVRDLEKEGIIKSKYIGNQKKHLYLTQEGIKLTNEDTTWEPSEETFLHDLKTVELLNHLLKYERVLDGKLYHQLDQDLINPDAYVLAAHASQEYEIALELELTQKSQKRIQEKFRKYGASTKFDYVVFLSQKEGLLRAYNRFLGELEVKTQEKVFLVFSPDLIGGAVDLEKSHCLYKGKSISITKVFGGINEQ